LREHPLRCHRRPDGAARSNREARGSPAARRYPPGRVAHLRGARDRAAQVRPRGSPGGCEAMTAITEVAPASRSSLMWDRRELIGPLFIAPAILYVAILVALPFFLALYYSVSAYTTFNPTYRFVGFKNFIDVMESDIFRRTLINTFVFTIGAQVIGL